MATMQNFYFASDRLCTQVMLLVLSCLVCNCCWLAVCIVVVVLCVFLSSYVYLSYCVWSGGFFFVL